MPKSETITTILIPKCSKCGTVVTKENAYELYTTCNKRKCKINRRSGFEAACDVLDVDPEDLIPVLEGSCKIHEERRYGYNPQSRFQDSGFPHVFHGEEFDM